MDSTSTPSLRYVYISGVYVKRCPSFHGLLIVNVYVCFCRKWSLSWPLQWQPFSMTTSKVKLRIYKPVLIHVLQSMTLSTIWWMSAHLLRREVWSLTCGATGLVSHWNTSPDTCNNRRKSSLSWKSSSRMYTTLLALGSWCVTVLTTGGSVAGYSVHPRHSMYDFRNRCLMSFITASTANMPTMREWQTSSGNNPQVCCMLLTKQYIRLF